MNLKSKHGAFIATAVATLVLLVFWVAVAFSLRNALPLPQLGFAHDIGVMLDAGWRYHQGQMPHRDYISPLGPAYALLVGLPLSIGGMEYTSYLHLPTFLGLVMSLLALAAAFNRMPVVAAVFYSLLVGMVAGGTYHIGWPPEWTTFATLYNRVCWSMLMVLGIALCLPSKSRSAFDGVLVGFVSGGLLGVLLFFKVTFFFAGTLIAGVGILLYRRELPRFFAPACVLAFVLMSVFFSHAIGWNVGNMIRDLSYAAEARRLSFFTAEKYWYPGRMFLSNVGDFALVVSVLVTAAVGKQYRLVAVVLSLTIIGFAMIVTNSSGNGSGIPLTLTALVVGAVLLARYREALAILASGAAASMGLSSLLMPQVQSWQAWRDASKALQQKQVAAVDAPRGSMKGFFENGNNQWREMFVPLLREGMQLIEANVPQDKTLLYVDFTNIFNFATRARSPRNTLLWYDENGSLARTNSGHPEADMLFGDVDFVMIPKRPFVTDGIGIWLDLYKDYLERHYRIAAESPNFWMFAKKAI